MSKHQSFYLLSSSVSDPDPKITLQNFYFSNGLETYYGKMHLNSVTQMKDLKKWDVAPFRIKLTFQTLGLGSVIFTSGIRIHRFFLSLKGLYIRINIYTGYGSDPLPCSHHHLTNWARHLKHLDSFASEKTLSPAQPPS